MQQGQPLIRLEGVQRVYTTEAIETHAVAGVDLSIWRAEYVSIEGPSGSGKSTLLTLLGLLDEPSSGRYVLAEVPTSEISSEERARLRNREIGFVFQSFNLIPEMSVEDNVALPLQYRRGESSSTRRSAVKDVLELVGMSNRARHRPSQLSGGQQQRVAVARALIGKPSLILADEPTGNLDQENGEQIMQLLEDLNRSGVTLIVVTHNPSYAGRAGRLLRMRDGHLLDGGRPR